MVKQITNAQVELPSALPLPVKERADAGEFELTLKKKARPQRPDTERARPKRTEPARQKPSEPKNTNDDAPEPTANDAAKQTETTAKPTAKPGNAVTEAAPANIAEAAAPAAETAADEALAALAALLQIPPELVAQWLESLGIDVSALADPAVANRFLQLVFDVQNPVELLNIPEYKTLLTAVTQLAATLPQTPLDTQTFDERLNGLRAIENADRSLVIEPIQPDTEASNASLTETDGETDAQARQHTDTRQAAPEPFAAAEAPVTTEAPAALSQTQPTPDNAVPVIQTLGDTVVMTTQTQTVTLAQQPASQADAAGVAEQIMSRIRLSGENFAELRITLKPESLGDVSLRVAVQNGVVAAMFVAENSRVKEIIESNFNQLKDALQQQGVNISQLSVSVGRDDAQERMYRFLRGRRSAAARIQRLAQAEAERNAPRMADPREVHNNLVDFSA